MPKDSFFQGPLVWLYERTPAVVNEDKRQEDDVSWIGHAEELRREGRLIRRVCEGARDAMHVRSRLEARAGAGCRRQRRRLEIWIVAPLGIGSEEARHVSHGLRRPFCLDVLHSRCQNLGSRPPGAAQVRRTAAVATHRRVTLQYPELS